MNSYPIENSIENIKRALRSNKNVILTAEPGAGKSTIVPISLKDEEWLKGKKIIMLQPRRVAAVAIAKRMSELDGSKEGTVIGHRVRFSSNVTSETKIEVVTEGILTKRIQSDPFLEDIGLVIFDEFHERSIHADLSLALCREIQKEIRQDLRIMVMSATIDTKIVSDFLPNNEIIYGKGFLYPVEIAYNPVSSEMGHIFENMAKMALQIVSNSDINEDYLIFLPGAYEINLFYSFLQNNLKTNHEIMCLYGSLDIKEQEKAINKGSKPRIILSTNIAETSLTINGITTVIDSGYCKRINFDKETGLDKLELCRISKASAKQRAGRAGRLRSGRCIRLWSKAENEFLQDNEIPEILRTDITSTVLEIIAWGCSDPLKFAWLEMPKQDRIIQACNLLRMLKAIDEKGNITAIGKNMSELPIDARLAKMLITASQNCCSYHAALISAIMSEKDFVKPDLNGQINADIEYRLQLIENNQVSSNETVKRISKIANQLFRLVNKKAMPAKKYNKDELRKAMLSAFPDRVCIKRKETNAFTICSGTGLTLPGTSTLSNSEYILALKADSELRQSSASGKIFLACEIKKDWLLQNYGLETVKHSEINFSNTKKKVIVREQIKYDKIIISEKESSINQENEEQAAKVFIKAVIENISEAFNLEEAENANFINRVRLLNKSEIINNFPLINEEWFTKLLNTTLKGIYSFDELHKYKLSELYFMQLPYSYKETFDKLVPERYRVPSGSNIRLTYNDSDTPVLAVKLQELFGQTETPSICNGKIRLMIHLLSPAGRPVQVTQDLTSFWQNGYKQIVGELRGKYPKHPWPEDPTKAIPTAKTNNALRRQGLL